MNTLEKIQIVEKIVTNYFDNNSRSLPAGIVWDRDHIIDIGTSILCTKWKIGYEGGSFVQAVVNNDLMRAIGNADNVNQQALPFYCKLMYNTGKPVELND